MNNSSYRTLLLTALLSFAPIYPLLSQITFKGIVRDSLSGQPVAGAIVKTIKFPVTVATDKKGVFSVMIDYIEGETVEVSSDAYNFYIACIDPMAKDNVILLTPVPSKLDEVVVTATRTPKKIKAVPVYTTMISAATIRNSGIRNFTSILENEIPGVEFTNNAGVPNIDMQGLGGNYVLVLVDGERLAGETRNNIDYNSINTENIERIEIVKGTSSTLYGSNAMGGVINIITKKNKKSIEGILSGVAGSHGYQNYNGTAGVKRKCYIWQTNLRYKRNDSYMLQDRHLQKRIYADRVEFGQALRSIEVEGGSIYSAEQRFAYTGVPQLDTEAKGSYFKRERFNAGEEGRVMHNFYEGLTAAFKAGYEWSEGQHIRGSYNFSDYRKYNYYRIADIQERDYLDALHSLRIVSDNRINASNAIVAGIEYMKQSLDTYMFTGNSSFSNTSTSTFLQHDYKIGSKLTLLSGLRLDKNSSYGEHLSPKIAFKADFLPSWSLRASYAEGFRSPGLKELYTNWDHLGMFQIIGNPSLQPEKNRNVIATLTFSSTKVNFGVNIFNNEIRDKIGLVQNSANDTIQYRNFSWQRLYGGEFSAEVKVVQQGSLHLGYSFVNDGMYENGYSISTTRPHGATIKIEYHLKREKYSAVFNFSGRYKSSMTVFMQDDSDDYYKVEYPDYSLWRFNCLFRYKDCTEFNFSIDNIFDYTALTNDFYTPPTSGRTYQLGMVFYIDSVINKAI